MGKRIFLAIIESDLENEKVLEKLQPLGGVLKLLLLNLSSGVDGLVEDLRL